MNPTQPQGIEAILAALQGGGAPMGQLGKVPVGVNPSAPAVGMPAMAGPGAVPAMPMEGAMPAPGTQAGASDPLATALSALQPEQIQLILNALLRGGAFNSQVQPG